MLKKLRVRIDMDKKGLEEKVEEIKQKVKVLEQDIESNNEEISDLKDESEDINEKYDNCLDFVERVKKFLNQVLGKDHLESYEDLEESRKEAQRLKDEILTFF